MLESRKRTLANVQAVEDPLLSPESRDVSEASTNHGARHPHTERAGSPDTVTVSEPKPDMAWEIEQGFFAVMGGYAVKSLVTNPKTFATSQVHRIIAVDGLIKLARVGLLPSMSSQDIEDRSRADIFAKIFVLSQIIWFGLQVISRLATGLVVTPLEAHTAIHVACTIVVYLIWLKKPYNIDTPIILENNAIEDMVTLFTFSEINDLVYQDRYRKYETLRERYWKDRHVRNTNNILDHDPPPDPPTRIRSDRLISLYTSEDSMGCSTAHPGDSLLKRLAPAAQRGLSRLSKKTETFDDFRKGTQRVFLRDSSENFMIRAVWGSWSTNTGHEWSMDKAFHLLFNLLYGSGHLAAWASSSFPTEVERWIWRGSSIMLAAVPLWGGLWILWWRAVGSKKKILFPFRNGDLDIAAAPFFFLVMCMYVLARCYFLVESLVSLRSLPESAYKTVQWPNVFPHVS